MNGKEPIKQLAALFDRDHDRLLKMLANAAWLCERGSRQSAALVYGEFRRLQDRHLAAEDAALEQLGREGGCPEHLATRIRSDHVLLAQLIELTWSLFNRTDSTELAQAMRDLVRAVAAHERTEKEELLPALCACIRDPARLQRTVYELVN
jgi:hypothetical protein